MTSLISVGVVEISKQENSRLLNGTATARKDQKQYVVELELFHQLHCLVRVRSYSPLSHPVCQLTLVRNGFEMYFGSWPRGQTPAVLLGPINGKTIPLSYVECLNQRALKANILLDHFIDFIRQTIMCHGDITPITFEWIDELGSYIAHHTTRHQCRDFDTIYQWAKRRDTTGMHADGKHKNVEFSQQEKVD